MASRATPEHRARAAKYRDSRREKIRAVARAGYARRRDTRGRGQSPGSYAAAARRMRTRRALLNELKSKPCADCGHKFDPVCMDFDHRPGEVKLFEVAARAWGRLEPLLAEIAKCDLVCANCHRLRTKHRGRK